MDRINNIWQQMEQQPPDGPGLLKTRYSTDIIAELYLGLLTPQLHRCLLLKVKPSDIRSFQVDKNLKGLKIQKLADPKNPEFVYLNLILLNEKAKEIFDILIQDIINKIEPLTDTRKILHHFVERIETWRLLFDQSDIEFLSSDAQQGLYAELYFLRKWLTQPAIESTSCVHAWLGPDNELRDFQYGDCAVEVKSTRGNNHQKIHINSERQLDTSRLSQLWLYHLSLEIQQANGETLNQIVDSIFALLEDSIVSQTEFKAKLLRGGYFDAHRQYYNERGYQIRQENFYLVRDNFPRIEEKTVPRGIGDVKYSVILSEYADFIVSETTVFETFGEYGRNK